MKSHQLKIDFEKKIRIVEDDEKLGELPLSIRITDKFKSDLKEMAAAKGCDSVSELCMSYLINGYTEDYKTFLLLQQSGNKTLRELLK